MNKKGFTLVELLGVIVVLGLIIVLVATNGFGLLNKTKSAINKVEEDNLMEAARVFLVDVDNGLCEDLRQSDCDIIKNYISGKSVEIMLQEYEDGFRYGDVNQDGKIDAKDITLVAQYVSGTVILDETQKILADVNEDGNVTDFDICERDSYTTAKKISVKYLIDNEYFKDSGNHCDVSKELKLKIEKDADGNTIAYRVEKADEEDVICTK